MDESHDFYILPNHPRLSYCGRIDFDDPENPVFVYPSSWVKIRFRGKRIDMEITNLHSYYSNSVGIILDGIHRKIDLPESGRQRIRIADGLEDGEHELTLYKRMDTCHYFLLHGFWLNDGARLLEPSPLPQRRMEFYGDSVTAGELTEAVEYCGKPDPEHNGEYTNSWHSYAWYTARRLNAQIHNISQGGIALLEGTGYYCPPKYVGMEYMYDKIQSNAALLAPKTWEFNRYIPHVVVVAIGQNDNYPEDYMAAGLENAKALHWMKHYEGFLRRLRGHYPNAVIILSTTILNHHPNWDLAIDTVCRNIADPKFYHFLYTQNGCGTPGHIRAPEAEKMGDELSSVIESLGDHVWEEQV